MREPTPKATYLKDYVPSAFLIPTIDLDVAIFEDHTRISARLSVRRNPAAAARAPLVLDGEELALESVTLDGRPLGKGDYALDAEHLTIPDVPDEFVLETVCRIRPRENTRLEGFFASKDGYFSQCEAEGFRRITFFIDRPDVMARYTTTLHADKARYPVLLANGNLVASGEEPADPVPSVTDAPHSVLSPAGGGGAGRGHNGSQRHWAKWEDPFPKPCYLFAMVAARLDVLEDRFVTRSGKTARLAVYVEPGKRDQAAFAMDALKKAMKWDEEVFGLELDLDHYMIVAVGDFNAGAMENKGLNIFNTRYVLARPDTATDEDYQNIDRVVGHEYFHNWTGNRVTCRDWFQLSLKEGLTVFREQEFGADLYSRAVQRIREVRALRARQFPEDASPMAHPVRPQSYMEISNFYTTTVYEKGAEVVRMIHTLIGAENFRKGMDLYFQRHDGQAVTTDDFVQAMADAAGVDLAQFKRWYDEAGTPTLDVTDAYDAASRRYTLTVRQSLPPLRDQARSDPTAAASHAGEGAARESHHAQTPPSQHEGEGTGREPLRTDAGEGTGRGPLHTETPPPSLAGEGMGRGPLHTETPPPSLAGEGMGRGPLHIPFAVGLVAPDGRDIPLRLEGEKTALATTRVLSLTEPAQRFVFEDVPARPVPSLAREFSAPVIVKYGYDEASLTHLMAHDSDPFNRWEAGQRLATALILKGVDELRAGREPAVPDAFMDAFARVLARAPDDPAFTAEALALPSEIFLAEQMEVVDPDAIHAARTRLTRAVAERLHDELLAAYRASAVPGPYSPDAVSAGKRALRSRSLAYLMETQTGEACALVFGQFSSADNMTDGMAALAVLADFDCPERTQALEAFYQRWKDEPLVVDKWLRVQATSRLPGTLAEVRRLTSHPAFSITNPNKVYSLIGAFVMGNHVRFHAAGGSGYEFLAEQVIALDQLNPQVAARMARAFDRWKKFDPGRQAHARAALERIRNAPGLSKDVTEIVTKALG